MRLLPGKRWKRKSLKSFIARITTTTTLPNTEYRTEYRPEGLMHQTTILRLTALFGAIFGLWALSPALAHTRPQASSPINRGKRVVAMEAKAYPAPFLPATWVWLSTAGAEQ